MQLVRVAVPGHEMEPRRGEEPFHLAPGIFATDFRKQGFACPEGKGHGQVRQGNDLLAQ